MVRTSCNANLSRTHAPKRAAIVTAVLSDSAWRKSISKPCDATDFSARRVHRRRGGCWEATRARQRYALRGPRSNGTSGITNATSATSTPTACTSRGSSWPSPATTAIDSDDIAFTVELRNFHSTRDRRSERAWYSAPMMLSTVDPITAHMAHVATDAADPSNTPISAPPRAAAAVPQTVTPPSWPGATGAPEVIRTGRCELSMPSSLAKVSPQLTLMKAT